MLVRMLRTEVGEVSNRGAWGDPRMATPEIMQLYKAPLRLQGWAPAIMEVCSTSICHPTPQSLRWIFAFKRKHSRHWS
jgi:hypothetical protein